MPNSSARFQATHWSLILQARNTADAHTRRRDALQTLALTYWPPLYAYLRRQGHPAHRAEDLTQEFFSRLLEPRALASVDPAKGKFRSFLLAALQHFVSNQRAKDHAVKRGGRATILHLDTHDAESRCGIDPPDLSRTPEQEFHHRWALTVLSTVIAALKDEFIAKSQLPLFDALHATLTGELIETHAVIAARLNTTEGALQVAAHRLRKRYRELLRAHIAQTVADPALIDEELRDLLNAL